MTCILLCVNFAKKKVILISNARTLMIELLANFVAAASQDLTDDPGTRPTSMGNRKGCGKGSSIGTLYMDVGGRHVANLAR